MINGQVYITTDTADTNNNTNPSAYGTTGATGHVYNMNINTGVQGTTVVVEGGATSVINSGLGVYSGSSDQQSRLGTDATNVAGLGVDTATTVGLKRKLWLRSQ